MAKLQHEIIIVMMMMIVVMIVMMVMIIIISDFKETNLQLESIAFLHFPRSKSCDGWDQTDGVFVAF